MIETNWHVTGIQSLKAFLDAIHEDEKSSKVQVLKEYLQAQVPEDEDDKTAVYMPDVMQTWSYAAQKNIDSLLSAVPAVLALLYKVMSTKVEFAPYGVRLGRTLLMKNQLELISRGTTTNKAKDFVISPALRLLREIIIFDGGVLAKQVFRTRDESLKGLSRNLGIRHSGEGFEQRRKPSVRTNAMRIFLALLKFLPAELKKELLKQRDIVGGATRDINRDPPYLIVEFLDATRTYVLKDETLQRDGKSKLLNASNLARIVQLYGYTQPDEEIPEGAKSIDALVNEWLTLACTSHDLGLLYRQSGFYPKDVNADDTGGFVGKNKYIDLGLDSMDWADKYNEKVPVRNMVLSDFCQTLRPWSSIDQSDLLLAIFKAAPELVADYFFKKKSFTFDPKLTATWMGYSAFLFSAIQLPVPKFFGHRERYGRAPPPTQIVIESILPLPMNQKVLTKCLGQKHPLITFFVTRLLTVAFQKLQKVLVMYREASGASNLWNEAAEQLKQEFCRRCPAMKDTILAFRGINELAIVQKQASSKLLVMYYEVVPELALEASFDVSAPLAKTLKLLETDTVSPQDKAMRVMQAESLFHIAHCSPGMQWFSKAKDLSFSPFTYMLRLLGEASADVPLLKLRSILDALVKENGILQHSTTLPPVDALVAAIKTSDNAESVLQFVDNCALRCSNTPIKYIDALEQEYASLRKADSDTPIQQLPISLIHFAMLEQFPFIIKSGDEKKIAEVSAFIARYLAASLNISEDKQLIKSLSKSLAAAAEPVPTAAKTIEKYKKLVDEIEIATRPEPAASKRKVSNDAAALERQKIKIAATLSTITLPDYEDMSPLTKWVGKEIEPLIEDHYTTSLIHLLSSLTQSARMQALVALQKISFQLKGSNYPEKEPIWLLLCELLETSKSVVKEGPVPCTITGFAASAVRVLVDPLHVLYPKVNHFLTLGPTWDLDKLPLVHAVISTPPSLDDARYQELEWLLEYLHASLVGKEELNIFYKRRVFEKILGLYSNVYLSDLLREKILQIIWQATEIEGGSETLLTRFGVVSWLSAEVAGDGKKAVVARVVLEKLLDTCSEERLEKWSGRTYKQILDGLVDETKM